MTQARLQLLVDRAAALYRELCSKSEEFETLKSELIKKAKLQPDTFFDTHEGGKRWFAFGKDGNVALVIFPPATPLRVIDAGSELARNCQALAGEHFHQLFAPVEFYRVAQDFQIRAAALLPFPGAEELTQLVESEGTPRVCFTTLEDDSAFAPVK